jgi:ABC-type multidrug transport system fused ATPase/permease subunit
MILAVTDATNESAGQYAQAGGLATEMLTGIRTVTALNAQPDAITRYRKFIFKAMNIGVIKGLKVGLGNGITFCATFFTYALGFWYGAKLVADQRDAGCTENCLTGGTVVAVFFCVIIGGFALGQLGPPLGFFVSAKAAAGTVMELVRRKPLIDGLSDEGDKPVMRPKGKHAIILCYDIFQNLICSDVIVSHVMSSHIISCHVMQYCLVLNTIT